MSTKKKLLEAAAGNAGEGIYVDDVFSTYLYEGTGSGQTITNGIDLDGEGGLVWGKPRNDASNHIFMDTERYPTPPSTGSWLSSNSYEVESTSGVGSVTSWNSDGLGITGVFDFAVHENVLWTFRKQPGFFDVVTWTGTGSGSITVSHNLGSVPGTILVKARNAAQEWFVYHRSLGATKFLHLSTTGAAQTQTGAWNDTEPTSTEFTGGSYLDTNGRTYVAYLFAHDAQDFGTNSDESIIKCGSYTGNGSNTGPIIDLGFEPQFLILKNVTTGLNWFIFDTMRGLTTGGNDEYLKPNASDAAGNLEFLSVNSTGFQIDSSYNDLNKSGDTFIYVAIRRPHKPAEEFAATDLFGIDTFASTADGDAPGFRTSFPVDMAFSRNVTATSPSQITARLTQGYYLTTESTSAEIGPNANSYDFDFMNGYRNALSVTPVSNVPAWMFRRAPGFFDVVAYTGDNTSSKNINHNLDVAPEMMILKSRDIAVNWLVYHKDIGNTKTIYLNSDNAETTASSGWWNNTTPTDTVFTVGANPNQSSWGSVIAYLFASVPGISKVGSYTGTGSDVDVDCGFTSGARFVLVKRTDSTGDWYVWDSVRGIVAGNDPYLLLNSTAAQVTSTDYIDPLSSGFTITSSAPAALNASGGNYIFLAIA